MELKVWVEGIQRIVCGVTENTTCQDVVFALAHATGKSGRFTLIERWRNNERQLAPNENPMKVLLKWGEYCNDVQFILQRNDVVAPAPIKPIASTNHSKAKSSPTNQTTPPHIQTSFSETFTKVSYPPHENVGVVKGIPQQHPTNIHLEVKGVSSTSTSCSPSPHQSPKKSSNQLETPFYMPHQRIAPPYKDPPAPPPYRDPPPPSSNKNKNILLHQANWVDSKGRPLENGLYNAQYRELIALINYQREKLSNQQVDITKCDAEIGFWESKEREKQLQLDFIAQEMVKINDRTRINKEQIQALVYVEEESEIVKQQEKTLKSEITLLRSKLANCETELLQCKNKMRLLMDQLQAEQKFTNKKTESRKQIERNVLVELDRIQTDIESAKRNSELHHLTAETLKKEVAQLETAIIEKKKRVEQLVNEMKEANLQSLTIAPSDEVRHLLEGVTKGPTTRKMIGSPRQLENAVPTSKNPHGVWV